MRKWVIKQPWKDAPLQVWEYIDDVEEAMQYWYVRQAIEKYGVDEIVPLAMNSLGGYHPLKPDAPEVVAIIESETEPTLSLIRQYPIAKGSVANGWMSPECVTYTCDGYGHARLAERICDEFYHGSVDRDDDGNLINAPDDKLLNKGWIKITAWRWLGYIWLVNDAQVKRCEELGYEHF